MRLLMFDVDGTLIRAGGAGMRAFHSAIEQVFQVSVGREVIRPDGKTDPLIAKEILAWYGMEQRLTEPARDRLFFTYLNNLEAEMSLAAGNGALKVLPGVINLLDRLAREPDFLVGLATGNLEKGTEIKLRHARLDRYFRFGGFGSDSEDRTELIRQGIRRGTRLCAPTPVEAAFVIGDTPLDIIHGHGAGARVLAVASAKYSMADMEPCRPDMLVPDLTDVDNILSFFGA
jgi:phosphoglycolate phosphatase